MAEQRREYKINQIEEAKLKIENIYREISKTLDDTIKNTTIRNDIPLLTTENKGLIAAIEKKTIHVKEIEEVKAKHEKEMNALKEKEAELNNNKAKMDEQYNNIESRRIEAIRILADPIDSTEYEEKAVSDLEQDAQNTENRYEAIRKSDERDDTAKILAQIEKLEQQNIKRKMIISQKKVVLDNQKKFRERRVLEDQKRIQQQKEAIEKLKNQFAEAEKARAERATKEAEEDVREEHSLPVKKYIPAGKIRDANDLIEQVKLFEQKNQEHLDKIVSEISQMEQKFKNTRAADQEKWKRMMRRVDTYTKRITKKDGMLLSISEMNEKNEELTEKLKTLIQSKDQMKRRKHLNLTRKEEYPDDGPSYDTISAQLKEKQIQLDQRKEILEDRSKELEHRKIEVDSIEKTVNEKQRKVLLIEAEVAKYKDVMSNAVDDLNNNQVSLDNTISTLETTL
ncbi:hypothetical protein TRFO_12441 [Tritrichomonas foetus]|uniref:Uncharacterized protein n=1 Tax=Tritrichomonas foetus TaxID=1144522 RepID=A0A1J4L1B4_9EUKA|nr:hypothetical protein TRFO_12441 [Tritrichomonas foetus]|eukprot:OHT17305.1 hypothetical protein TRFO_12441 [Tritrichomonas foetus]